MTRARLTVLGAIVAAAIVVGGATQEAQAGGCRPYVRSHYYSYCPPAYYYPAPVVYYQPAPVYYSYPAYPVYSYRRAYHYPASGFNFSFSYSRHHRHHRHH